MSKHFHFGCFRSSELKQLQQTNTAILVALKLLQTQGHQSMAALDALTIAVAKNSTVVGSAITLIKGLSAQLTAAGTDPVKLQGIIDQLAASDNDLAVAVATNTAAAGEPPSPPTEPPPATTPIVPAQPADPAPDSPPADREPERFL
jgi:hypothetical protein